MRWIHARNRVGDGGCVIWISSFVDNDHSVSIKCGELGHRKALSLRAVDTRSRLKIRKPRRTTADLLTSGRLCMRRPRVRPSVSGLRGQARAPQAAPSPTAESWPPVADFVVPGLGLRYTHNLGYVRPGDDLIRRHAPHYTRIYEEFFMSALLRVGRSKMLVWVMAQTGEPLKRDSMWRRPSQLPIRCPP